MNIVIDTNNQSWEKLTLANDFLFGKIMRDKSLCTEMIKRILPHIDIGDIQFPEVQKTLREGIDTRGIRLDVYSKSDNGKVYDIEIQTTSKKDLAKRSRAYHISIGNDILNKDTLKKTHTYKDLPDTFVIFICTFDPFNQQRHIYTFKNICCEDNNLLLHDGAVTIFLNAKGKADDISPELKAFLNFIIGISSEDPFIKELEKHLERARQNSEWRREFMMMSIWEQDKFEQGRSEERKNIAIQMIREGFPVDVISHIVKESISVIQNWIAEANS